MLYRLRTLLTQFSIRDLIWLTFVVAALTAWWHSRRENAAIRRDNAAMVEALEVKSQALGVAAKKESSLKHEVELVTQWARNSQTELAKRSAELRDSLERREEVLKALRTLEVKPPPTN